MRSAIARHPHKRALAADSPRAGLFGKLRGLAAEAQRSAAGSSDRKSGNE